MPKYNFEYYVHPDADELKFKEQCKALEERIPGLEKLKILHDVDDSKTQRYLLEGKNITVHNSYYIDAVCIESEVDLEQFLKMD